LAKAIADAASFIAQRGIADQSAPVVLRLVSQIAARFGVAFRSGSGRRYRWSERSEAQQ
jgi:hypothetical protein